MTDSLFGPFPLCTLSYGTSLNLGPLLCNTGILSILQGCCDYSGRQCFVTHSAQGLAEVALDKYCCDLPVPGITLTSWLPAPVCPSNTPPPWGQQKASHMSSTATRAPAEAAHPGLPARRPVLRGPDLLGGELSPPLRPLSSRPQTPPSLPRLLWSKLPLPFLPCSSPLGFTLKLWSPSSDPSPAPPSPPSRCLGNMSI